MDKKRLIDDIFGKDRYTDKQKNSIISNIDEALTSLSFKEQFVLRCRYNGMTLEEIGKCAINLSAGKNEVIGIGITRERVRQIEAKAIRKLKHPSRLKILRQNIINEKS